MPNSVMHFTLLNKILYDLHIVHSLTITFHFHSFKMGKIKHISVFVHSIILIFKTFFAGIHTSKLLLLFFLKRKKFKFVILNWKNVFFIPHSQPYLLNCIKKALFF